MTIRARQAAVLAGLCCATLCAALVALFGSGGDPPPALRLARVLPPSVQQSMPPLTCAPLPVPAVPRPPRHPAAVRIARDPFTGGPGLTEAERDVLDYLRINKAAHVADIASLIAKEEHEAKELLEGLYALRLARRGPAGESGLFQSV